MKELQAALANIDKLRQLLSKIDMRLMDSTSILAGYVKTKADMTMGVDPSTPPKSEEETNDQASASDSSESEE